MFGKKNTPCTLTVEALPDNTFPEDLVEDGIFIPLDEYKMLLRKEATLDLIANVCNDQAACKQFQYTWNSVLMFLCANAGYTMLQEDGEDDA